jgi:hypothetical protein
MAVKTSSWVRAVTVPTAAVVFVGGAALPVSAATGSFTGIGHALGADRHRCETQQDRSWSRSRKVDAGRASSSMFSAYLR